MAWAIAIKGLSTGPLAVEKLFTKLPHQILSDVVTPHPAFSRQVIILFRGSNR